MVGYHVEKRLIVSSGHFKRFRPQRVCRHTFTANTLGCPDISFMRGILFLKMPMQGFLTQQMRFQG